WLDGGVVWGSSLVYLSLCELCRQLPGCFLGQTLLIFWRQDFAGDVGGSFHHKPTKLRLELREHARPFLCRGFLRLDHDLRGGRNGLLGFLLLYSSCCRAPFFDQFGGLDVGFVQHAPTLLFSAGQLCFDLLGIG